MSLWLKPLVALSAVLSACSSSFAQEHTEQTRAGVLRVGTILHNPPYVTENPSGGIDIDIIRAAMAASDVSVEFVHAPIARVEKLLENGTVDAITTYPLRRDLCESSAAFSYWHDAVIVPGGTTANIRSMTDLNGRRVGMFPGAERVLEELLGPHIGTFESKVEIFSAPLVLRMLRYDRIDAYIGDFWALEHAERHDPEFKEQPQLFEIAFLVPPTPRSLCSADRTWLKMFDAGLEKIERDGQLTSILARYRPKTAE